MPKIIAKAVRVNADLTLKETAIPQMVLLQLVKLWKLLVKFNNILLTNFYERKAKLIYQIGRRRKIEALINEEVLARIVWKEIKSEKEKAYSWWDFRKNCKICNVWSLEPLLPMN